MTIPLRISHRRCTQLGEVHEVAEAITYFLTAEWTTGTVLEVDGGMALGITQG